MERWRRELWDAGIEDKETEDAVVAKEGVWSCSWFQRTFIFDKMNLSKDETRSCLMRSC
jgi:hypothetical protein